MSLTRNFYWIMSQLIISLTLAQDYTECVRKNMNFFKEDVTKESCFSVSKNCCLVTIKYKLPDVPPVDTGYCLHLQSDLNIFKANMTTLIVTDIVKHIKKNTVMYGRNSNIGANLKYNWTDNKKLWCPFNCDLPNTSTFQCDVLPQPEISKAADELYSEIKNFYNQPIDPSLNKCMSYDLGNNVCKLSEGYSGSDNPFANLELSLNFQYGMSDCLNPPCTQQKIDFIKNLTDSFYGVYGLNPVDNSNLPCHPTPSDLFSIDIVCPEGFVSSRFINLGLLWVFLYALYL